MPNTRRRKKQRDNQTNCRIRIVCRLITNRHNIIIVIAPVKDISADVAHCAGHNSFAHVYRFLRLVCAHKGTGSFVHDSRTIEPFFQRDTYSSGFQIFIDSLLLISFSVLTIAHILNNVLNHRFLS